MSSKHLKVQDFMTTHPHSIRLDETVEHAKEMMTKHGIRHLPVLEAGNLRGIVSERDMSLLFGMKHTDPRRATVEDIFEPNVYVTHPESDLAMVAMEMAEKRYGSAVVTTDGKVVGIFTTTDACRALYQVLSHTE